MRIARFDVGGETLLGSVDGDQIARISGRVAAVHSDTRALIAGWSTLRGEVEGVRHHHDYNLSEVTLLAPVGRPGKIWGIGLNYGDHIAESSAEAPKFQTWFAMAQTTVGGPYDPIERPRVSNALDYEAELVAIVGEGGRHIAQDRAASAIFGYCVGNDVSVRDWQLRTGQFSIGKAFDGHAPMGPWIVTADDIDVSDLGIRCFVNAEQRQSSSTRHLIFSSAAQIAHLSQAMTLEPGDVLFTGTPGGVGAAMKPAQFLKPGDVVRTEIDGLGHLENTVIDEPGVRLAG